MGTYWIHNICKNNADLYQSGVHGVVILAIVFWQSTVIFSKPNYLYSCSVSMPCFDALFWCHVLMLHFYALFTCSVVCPVWMLTRLQLDKYRLIWSHDQSTINGATDTVHGLNSSGKLIQFWNLIPSYVKIMCYNDCSLFYSTLTCMPECYLKLTPSHNTIHHQYL